MSQIVMGGGFVQVFDKKLAKLNKNSVLLAICLFLYNNNSRFYFQVIRYNETRQTQAQMQCITVITSIVTIIHFIGIIQYFSECLCTLFDYTTISVLPKVNYPSWDKLFGATPEKGWKGWLQIVN